VLIALFTKEHRWIWYDSLGTHTGSVPKVFLVHHSLDGTKNNKDRILPTKEQ